MVTAVTIIAIVTAVLVISEMMTMAGFFAMILLLFAAVFFLQSAHMKENINNEEVLAIRKEIMDYYDNSKVKTDAWKYMLMCGIISLLFAVVIFWIGEPLLGQVLIVLILASIVYYTFWFKRKKYLKDPNNAPNVSFWGNLKE